MPIQKTRLLAGVLCLALSRAEAQSTAPTIVIDPGHPSAVSSGAAMQNGTSEVHVAWAVAARLAALLTAEGYRVVRTKDAEGTMVTNIERARIGNASRDTSTEAAEKLTDGLRAFTFSHRLFENVPLLPARLRR